MMQSFFKETKTCYFKKLMGVHNILVVPTQLFKHVVNTLIQFIHSPCHNTLLS